MSSYEILTNAKRISEELGWMGKQVPFAIAKALTSTAHSAREELVKDWRERFIARSKWAGNQIKVRNASKHDRHPEAAVGSAWDAHRLRVEGGKRTPRPGQRFVAVPVHARRDKAAKTPKSKWPGALVKRSGFEEFQEKLPNGGVGMFQILKDKQRSLRLWWILKREVAIKRSWPWEQLAAESYRLTHEKAFEVAWAEAQRTARR